MVGHFRVATAACCTSRVSVVCGWRVAHLNGRPRGSNRRPTGPATAAACKRATRRSCGAAEAARALPVPDWMLRRCSRGLAEGQGGRARRAGAPRVTAHPYAPARRIALAEWYCAEHSGRHADRGGDGCGAFGDEGAARSRAVGRFRVTNAPILRGNVADAENDPIGAMYQPDRVGEFFPTVTRRLPRYSGAYARCRCGHAGAARGEHAKRLPMRRQHVRADRGWGRCCICGNGATRASEDVAPRGGVAFASTTAAGTGSARAEFREAVSVPGCQAGTGWCLLQRLSNALRIGIFLGPVCRLFQRCTWKMAWVTGRRGSPSAAHGGGAETRPRRWRRRSRPAVEQATVARRRTRFRARNFTAASRTSLPRRLPADGGPGGGRRRDAERRYCPGKQHGLTR